MRWEVARELDQAHGLPRSSVFETLYRTETWEAVERGRGAKPSLKLGICGEHAGEPSSVALCHELGLTYVSPSTYRVPVARLAAAQAALASGAARDR